MPVPKVGIFFVAGDRILIDAVPVEQGEPYGDAVIHGAHYEFWSAFVPRTPEEARFKARAYDAYPRGRVTYFVTPDTFRIYADRCINKNSLREIARAFDLPHIRVAQDAHYRCAQCNPRFLD